ncbi:Kelch repeat-containing protein [Flavobacterium sp. ARAG 55.4]|uniref:Kelch repeat-containing protein n=1 Tax=Flavobacterium sp. ARAG 55.4 TaxID=3451357 RepID=UPI003F484D57
MNRKKVYLFTLIHLLMYFTTEAQSTDLKEYNWTTIDTKGNVTARHESSMVEYNGKFYLIGGRGLNPVNVFDPKTNTWEEKAKPPFEMHHFQAVVYKDAIYVIAMTGKYPKEVPLENIWLYYPERDTWKKGPEIPENRRRGGAGAVVYNDKIYIVCGIDFGHTSGTNNNFDSYDLNTGKWEVLTKAPHIRDHFSAIIVDDNLYCIGGRNTSFHYPENFGAFFEQTLPYVDVYNFKENKWHTMKEQLPYPTAAGGLVYFQNKIIYFGGEGKLKEAYNTTQCFDLTTQKWSPLAPLNIGRHSGGGVVFDSKIYTAAGSPVKGGGNLDSVEVFSLN